MKHEAKQLAGLLELGSAKRETKGPSGIFTDDVLKRPALGLSDD